MPRNLNVKTGFMVVGNQKKNDAREFVFWMLKVLTHPSAWFSGTLTIEIFKKISLF